MPYFPFSLTNGLTPPPQPQSTNGQDLLDFQGSGKVQSSRYINPLTQDFELGSNGKYLGENATDQSVFLALLTTFNTTSVLGIGNNINRRTVPTIVPGTKIQLQNLINQCLGPLVQGGFIIMGNLRVQQTDYTTMAISFTYFNISLQSNQTINFTYRNGIASFTQ